MFWVLTGLLLVIFDQLTKWLAFRFESFGLSYFLYLAHFHNSNFAFSLPLPVIIMYVIYGLAFGFIGRYLYPRFRFFNFREKLAWVLVLAGGISNFVERIALGYVRDFIGILNGVFNLADAYIIIGVILLVVRIKLVSSK